MHIAGSLKTTSKNNQPTAAHLARFYLALVRFGSALHPSSCFVVRDYTRVCAGLRCCRTALPYPVGQQISAAFQQNCGGSPAFVTGSDNKAIALSWFVLAGRKRNEQSVRAWRDGFKIAHCGGSGRAAWRLFGRVSVG
jgi:hypothetical protein